MVDGIEEFSQIQVYDPFVSFIGIPECLIHGRGAAPTWAETMTPIAEYAFVFLNEHLCHGLLHHSVHHGGNRAIS